MFQVFNKPNLSVNMTIVRSKVESWEDKMGADRVISQPIRSLGVKEHWWLSNLINKFHYHGGFEKITAIIELPKTNIRVSIFF